ncbi:AAA family ATPase [Deinococcus lacus]|uniref:AAA family ATPase n=1 Tax=Deinococcus lacus TaxID=392561 RepID=A0ABW1Y9I9_9DEIO
MLLWINGPFGVGKTQAAYALARRLPRAFVCDPEQLGFGLSRMTPPELRGDFQDIPLWREGVRRVLDRNLSHFDGVVIVPMTLVNPAYFDEIVGELRRAGHPVCHVALLASRETLRRRLRSRGEGGGSWGAAQIERCLAGLAQLDPADHLQTDGLTHEQVVGAVAQRAGLTLGPLQRRWERLRVQLRAARGD